MVDDCFFCNIADKKVDVFDVFENKHFIAFLDINPVAKGHTLIIPKKHYTVLGQMSAEEVSDLFKIIKNISASLMKEFGAKDVQVNIPNGASAGQKAPHLIAHVIPVYDHLHFTLEHKKFDGNETDKIATLLKTALKK